MSLLLFLIIFILFIGPIGIFLRFLDLGLNARVAVHITFAFPFEIFRIHTSIYNHLKNDDKKKALRILFAPLTDLPDVITSYAEMHMNFYARMLAIEELLHELEDKDIRKLTKQLRKQGIIIKRKKIKKFDVHPEEFIDDEDQVNKYLNNLGFRKVADVY